MVNTEIRGKFFFSTTHHITPHQMHSFQVLYVTPFERLALILIKQHFDKQLFPNYSIFRMILLKIYIQWYR